MLGAVQGVTEVVPVSSSAHLALLPGLLGWPEPADRTLFAAALHAGSCAGLLWALRHELTLPDLLAATAASAPAAVVGLVAHDAVEARLGRPLPTAALLAGAGLLMAVADRRPSDRPLGRRDRAAAGLAQVAALAPGVSRSGAALTALRARRVPLPEAARWSLLMSLPVTAGAAGLTLLRADPRSLRLLAPWLVAGVPAAAVGAALAVGRAPRGLHGAALYRLGFAAAVVARHRKGPR